MNRRHRQQIDYQARYWLTRMTSGCTGPDDLSRFESWKAEHPLHEQAYAYLSALDVVTSECATAGIERASVNKQLKDNIASRYKRPATGIAWGAVAAGLIVAIVFGLKNPVFKSEPNGVIYSTQVGELREITLKDGSRVYLSGDTRIEVTYSEGERDIRLIRGEALFTVQHSPERPFKVYTNNSAVRAVGTAFDVHEQPTGFSVAVIEGVVSVTRGVNKPSASANTSAKPAQAVVIEKGQKISYRKGESKGVISYAPPEKFATWRKGVLEFDQVELESVIADINRYASGKIIIASDNIRKLPVTAVFAAGDFQEVAEILPHILPVKASVVSENKIVLSQRR